MVRVLHLLEYNADFQARRSAAALREHLGADFSIMTRTVGAGGDFRFPFLGSVVLARPAYQFDVLHAWGLRALMAAVFVKTGNVLFTPTQPAGIQHSLTLRMAAKHLNLRVAVETMAQARAFIARGFAPMQCQPVLPGIDAAPLKLGRDNRLRTALGFADGDYVLLAPGESTRTAAHRQALWAVSILHVLDPRYRILLWGEGPELGRISDLARKLRQPALLTVAREKLGGRLEFDSLTRVADAAIHTPAGPAPLMPVAMCMAAGLPMISVACPWVGDVLRDRYNAILATRGSPRALAQAILELRNDAALQDALSLAARATAHEAFQQNKCVEAHRSLYQRLATSRPGQDDPGGIAVLAG